MTKLERRKKRLKNLDRAGIQRAAERSILSVMIIHNVPMSSDTAEFMEIWLRDEGEYLFGDLIDDDMYTDLVHYASRMITEHNNKTRITQIKRPKKSNFRHELSYYGIKISKDIKALAEAEKEFDDLWAD